MTHERPCTCDTFKGPTEPWGRKRGNCRLCYLFHNDNAFRVSWGGQPLPGLNGNGRHNGHALPSPACVHRGRFVGREQLPCCCGVHPSGHLTTDVYLCGTKAGCKCTLRKTDLYPACPCPEFEARPPLEAAGQIRHLLYHVYPVRGNGVWQWNLDQLRQRFSLFNGRRVIAVAHDGKTDTPWAVRDYLKGCDCEFVEKLNVKELREVNTFPELFGTLESHRGPGDVTLFGHAKGVTSEKWSDGARTWTESLQTLCLDYWPVVQAYLQRHPVVGPWKRLEGFKELPDVSYHYAGSWRWFRNADFYGRDWQRIDRIWVGIEAHPARVWGQDEAACLCGEFRGMYLYAADTWRKWGSAVLQAFRADHYLQYWPPLLLTCVLVSHGKPTLVHETIASVQAQDTPDWQLVIIDRGDLADELRGRYAGDPRIRVLVSAGRDWCQGQRINEVLRSNVIRGDLVCYQNDDDVYHPHAFSTFLAAARSNPTQKAWYGAAQRTELAEAGERPVGCLPAEILGGLGGVSLNCRVDCMQFCHRAELLKTSAWSEDPGQAWHADGLFLDTLGRQVSIHPLRVEVGRHRHTPASTYTRPGGVRSEAGFLDG